MFILIRSDLKVGDHMARSGWVGRRVRAELLIEAPVTG